ncbi:hypothetical protein CN13_08255 [Petrotoga sp. HKA.pet.4.5]|uniref:peptidyl-prolyl cis-trans isomerase n=1 Tax=unclassified Petrotoga TaxID=2620614 RepID=UPI000EF1415B|nr:MULTISPECIES: peptidyl-prolyl cis-trans isomerase [unclassified Petrotoga]RLL86192.1 hypothetical protein BZ25_00625 [Petrotoga sp. Shatin.DS.tank11.9.2.9.3]RLL88579.1 hypothetical protein CN13_08255 [Petrotoga sp. HKA.pet.4.5]
MRKKNLLLLFFVFFISTVLYPEIIYQPLEQTTFAKVNDETLNEELLISRSQTVYLLSDLYNSYPEFYSVLTRTATGVELMNTYLLDQALKIVNQVLFIQFVEQKNIDLQREEIWSTIEENFSKTFKDVGIPDEEIDNYLLAIGYTSKTNYIEDAFYSTLYNNSISALYTKIIQETEITEEEMTVEYQSNQAIYKSDPAADIKLIIFNSTEDASYTYNRIIEGYYTYDEVFEQTDSATTMRIDLKDDSNSLVQTVKANPPGFITTPLLYDAKNGTYALLKIERKYPEKQLTFDEAKDQIIFNLKDKKAQEYFDKVLPNEFQKFQEESSIILNSDMF